MPSLFRGRSGSTTKSYENIELANNEDRSNGAGYYTETYTGGIAPVTIAIDEHDKSAEAEQPMRRSWKQRKPMSYFADKASSDTSSEKSSKSKKCVDTGEQVAAPNDLDVCCIEDGALGCLSFENMVVCSKEDAESKRQYTQIRSSKDNDDDDADVLPEMCPVKSGDESTIATGASNPLVERFRSMGAIRDKREGSCVQRYFYKFIPEPSSSEKGYTKQRLRLVLAAVTLLLIIIISAILGATIGRQKRNVSSKLWLSSCLAVKENSS